MAPSQQHPLQDPRYRYSSPNFEPQPQELSGSESAMKPIPDHGENTYRGNGRLKGLMALITGGDSGIGRAVASADASYVTGEIYGVTGGRLQE